MKSNAPSYAVSSPRKVSKTSITSLKSLVAKTISIRKNQGGVTYKDLFGNYLRTVKEICITAPFIRQPYQIRLKSQKSERISPFWVGGYPPFSAEKSPLTSIGDIVRLSPIMQNTISIGSSPEGKTCCKTCTLIFDKLNTSILLID